MRALGADAIRFSSAPALGGDGFVIEVSAWGFRDARVTVIGLVGYPRRGWKVQSKLHFRLAPQAYRRLSARIDSVMAEPITYRYRNENGEYEIVCMDGPGFLTERIADGKVFNLAGSCGSLHPNNKIGKALFDLFCSRPGGDLPERLTLKRFCRLWDR